MILTGELSLWVALLMAAWAATVSFAGGVQRRSDLIASGARAIYATLGMAVLASLGLWTALVTHDFSLEYVATNTSANIPLVYTASAFWGGPAGSLLLWVLALAGCSAIAVRVNRARHRALMPYVTGTLAVVLTFFLATLCLGANPYARLDWPALDGRGMNPQLQNPAMLLHPPSLYLGLAATSVLFAFAVAALITRRVDRDWTSELRRWVLASWLLLTVGIVSGMWWAYVEPGWHRDWVRDAVANGALFPWLVTAALAHSPIAAGKHFARKSNIVLLLSAFLLSVFSLFLTGGGIISVAHSFARFQPASWVAGFLIVAVAASIYLAATRLAGRRRDDAAQEGVDGDEPSLRSASSRFPRQFGARIALAGIVVLLVALAGQSFRTERTFTLGAGESVELRDPFGRVWRFASQGVSQYNEINRRIVAAALDVTRDGRSVGIVTSERRQYVNSRGSPAFEPSTEAGMLGSLTQDVHVALEDVGESERVRLRVEFSPLAVWTWIGGLIMALGGVISLAEAPRLKHE